MGTPQIILLLFFGMELGIGLIMHNKPYQTKFSFWKASGEVIFLGGLLWWGHFFG